ncbi:YegS/Rv2252/BmrU family lipid kinase [Floridanema aerugineum]|uniref:YegS/Rv2252/BmrU family lipid kinase n=1 Tax=Floridaenema aerugineum BLCC-F46 TaxID=3153654 RepID=A0ABV4X1L8_9CYAN
MTTLLPQPSTRLKRAKVFQKACLIFNPVAGQGDANQVLETIKSLLSPHLQLEVRLTTKEVGADVLAKEAVAQGAELIIAAGGDGTVSAAATAVVNTGIPLAVIPRGTANAFVNGLGLPNTVEKACIAILQGATRTVGTVDCNGKLMLLLAGIGFEADTVKSADRQLKNQFGIMAYIFAGLEQLQNLHNFQATLVTNRETISVPAAAITVASIAPPTSILAQGSGEMRPDDGLFDLTILSPASALDVLNAAVELFENGLVRSTSEDNHIGYLRSSKVTITTDPPQQIAVDGEMFGTTPVTFEVLPQSLKVVTDYNQAIAQQQKLVGLPGVKIDKNAPVKEVVLDYFLPVNPLDVLSEEFFQVVQAAINLWHKLTTAVKHFAVAVWEWGKQLFYELIWAIDKLIASLSNPQSQSGDENQKLTKAGRMPTLQELLERSIVHKTDGRIRLKIPRLSFDSNYAEKLRSKLQTLVGIQEININPLAASIAINFDRDRPASEIEQQILSTVAQVT